MSEKLQKHGLLCLMHVYYFCEYFTQTLHKQGSKLKFFRSHLLATSSCEMVATKTNLEFSKTEGYSCHYIHGADTTTSPYWNCWKKVLPLLFFGFPNCFFFNWTILTTSKYMKYHIYEPQRKIRRNDLSSQLYSQLKQLRYLSSSLPTELSSQLGAGHITWCQRHMLSAKSHGRKTSKDWKHIAVFASPLSKLNGICTHDFCDTGGALQGRKTSKD